VWRGGAAARRETERGELSHQLTREEGLAPEPLLVLRRRAALRGDSRSLAGLRLAHPAPEDAEPEPDEREREHEPARRADAGIGAASAVGLLLLLGGLCVGALAIRQRGGRLKRA